MSHAQILDALNSTAFVAADWRYVGFAMVAGMAMLAGVTASLPDPLAFGLMLAAWALTQVSTRASALEARLRRHIWRRYALLAGAVALPMGLFGAGLALWVAPPSAIDPVQGMAVLVMVSITATVILASRMNAIVVANLAIFLVPSIRSEVSGAWALLIVGAVIGVLAAWRQAKVLQRVRKQQRSALRRQARAEEILTEFERTGQGWFWETGRRGELTYLSPTIATLLGRAGADLIGKPFSELFVQDDPKARDGERTLAFHLTARSAFTELSIRAAMEGEERWWSITGRPIFDEFRNFVGFRGSGHDLTEKRRSAEQVARLAHFDSLTSLANRLHMSQTLEKILNAPDIAQRACAVFLLDLDRFKQVNDTLGHPAGDSLLTQVAQRLERAVAKHGRVGRLGGDEFQIIMVGNHTRESLGSLAEAIIADLSRSYTIEGHRVQIGASIGIALAPQDGVTSEAIIRNADLALYAAKDRGRGCFHFYANDLHADAEERLQLEQDLRDAIAHGGLELYYQPVVQTATEKITGFEALLRWHHPVRGPMSPAKFIPVAEEAGLIAQIGEWALRTACNDMANWPAPVRVAVNVSPLQFANPALPAIITSALASAQVEPSRLELEITESVFLNDDEGTDAMFAALKGIGVRLALDDFGTGYSSLGYLRTAPFDKIKIDQSFVRGAAVPDSKNGAIIAAIVSLAEAMGMETTAEGVETLDELDLVRMLGCSHVQGYIYERALSAEEASQRLASGVASIAHGPRSPRPIRQTMLRKVVLEHGGQHYQATIRNMSTTGAMIEGLWHVPPGTIFRMTSSDGLVLTVTTRWSEEDRMGVEFAAPVIVNEDRRNFVRIPQSAQAATVQAPPCRAYG